MAGEASRTSTAELRTTSVRARPLLGQPDPSAAFAPLDATALVHSAFLERAGSTPEALALSSVHGTYSYGELERVSRALALWLVAEGIGAGKTVAIYSDRNPALIACVLGVLRSGAAFQIVDAAYPLPRILTCVQRAEACALWVAGDLTVPDELAAAFPSDRRLQIPASPAAVPAQFANPEATLPEVDASGIAYVSFTSGSTGTPKGIVTGHAPLPHFVAWHAAHGALTAHDRFSLLSGLSHDPLLRDIFTPLSLGASLHIPEQTTIFDADALWAWFLSERITVAHLTPALGEILATGAPDVGQNPHLRRLYWGGDVLGVRLMARLNALCPRLEQTNFYGATETPQAMAYFDLKELGERSTIPIGRGIEGAQLLVMDESGKLCALGETGEIWIRSPYLSRGYLGDPAETARRFVQNPYTEGPRDLCYRTGDQGRYLEDGEVAFAGRADHQIKVRGFRIEPAEIVLALERRSGVRRALVLAHELHGEKQLTAYVAGERAAIESVSAIRSALSSELPSYMVPQHVLVLDAFPLLPNGKIDLQALPSPTSEPSEDGSRRLARNDQERELARIWAELLGLEQVGIDESFLELGGDSLTAIRALSRMRRLGIAEDVARGILQGRTIAELCGETPTASGDRAAQLSGTVKTTLLVNVMRGALVLLLVFDHWREGLFKRLSLSANVLEAIEPLFHLPTPGFAFVFGIGLGYTHYPTYRNNPRASRRLLQGGALILAAGTLLMGLSRNAGIYAKHEPLDYDLFCTNFFLPTLYYCLALASAPWWFSFMRRREGKWGGAVLAALLIAGVFRGVYELMRVLMLEHEQTGLLQLGRLMLTARFSYFNLSTGALLGVGFGVYLRSARALPNLAPRLFALGVSLLGVGLFSYLAQREQNPYGMISGDIWLPEWFFYIGVTLLLGALFEQLLLVARGPVRAGLEWVGVVGQCAMPIFILQGMVFDVSAFGRALGLSHALAIVVALAGFALAVGWMMRRIHGLYYGKIESLASSRAPAAAL